ncbi:MULTISPECIES: RDD family protein [Niastella]|uniref:RDD family protein n=1 Tax=Niastella soli TaxID=2821487 RepID=A0ABS3YNY0_9BACT|nr:RDD family protein [Niastella soli]MBO9199589.1 RDD family protein [Niastella soli]
MEQQDQVDLLQDVNEEANYMDPAPRGLRLVNHIVDQVVIGVAINGVKSIIAFSSKTEAYKNSLFFREDLAGLQFSLLVSLGTLLLYYTVFEATTNGRTIGKMLTGTTAITQDGSPFTFKHAFLRTLCRFIPLEPFSTFGYLPWHDSITKTAVVKKTW